MSNDSEAYDEMMRAGLPKKKGVHYRTRSINPGYYQKLALRGKKVVAVSGYLRKPGKDIKLYEKVL